MFSARLSTDGASGQFGTNVDGHVRLAQILDLFGEDSWRRVHADELGLRPPGAPTNGRMESRPQVNANDFSGVAFALKPISRRPV
jgi:hypothetical protein